MTAKLTQNVDTGFSFHELLKLLWMCIARKDHQNQERAILSKKYSVWFAELFLSTMGWILSISMLIFSLLSISDWTSIIFLIISVTYITILIPKIGKKYRTIVNGYGGVIVKLAFASLGIVWVIFIQQPIIEKLHNERRAEEDRLWEIEKARLEALSPEEKEVLARAKRENWEKQAAENARLEEKRKQAEIQAAAAEWDRRQGKIAAKEAISKDKEIKEDNKHQNEFYANLGSPKLLYRCNGSDLEVAIGAKFGNINSLLAEANAKCSSGYRILKRDD